MTAVRSPSFAIIVPTRNEARNIGRLLASIGMQRGAAWSVVIVDQQSTDRTVEIARTFGCAVVSASPTRFYSPPGPFRNLGARDAIGEVFLHLDADMELPTADFLVRLGRMIDAAHQAIVIRERDVASGFWGNCKALERRCYWGTRMEAARAATRDLFLAVGGYDQAVASGEDFLITARYASKTEIASSDDLFVYHHLGRPSLISMLKKKYLYGRTVRQYLTRAGDQGAESAMDVVRDSVGAYLANIGLLRAQPTHYIGIFVLRALEFAAVRAGLMLGPQTQ